MSDWVTLKEVLGLTLRPVQEWPGKARYRRDRGPFSASLKDTLATLKRELRELSAKKIVLQIAFREQDFRLDGLPRAGAIASHPGVILTFDSRHGPLRIYFDAFTDWKNNLRAIAQHLEHLRLAGLYGVGTDGQQYQGWKALPPPEPESFTSAEDAALFLATHSGMDSVFILSDTQTQDTAYRKAAAKLHPDAGGAHDDFVRLQRARELLRH